MKIVADNKIPYLKGALEPFAEVVYLPGNKINPNDVKNADALITRTRTQCDARLLEGSKIKFIATATIGFDHIDTDYCKKAGISWTNAAGCNSGSVMQFIGAALAHLSRKFEFETRIMTIGIVGVGNVGTKVAKLAETLGMNILLNDPPREQVEGKKNFVSLNQVKEEADIISFHVPLSKTGPGKTYHLGDSGFFKNLKKKSIIINSSRGPVIDNQVLKKELNSGKIKAAVLDVWENEPAIDEELLQLVEIGTPHIAGYSRDGKANGTAMSVRAISRFFNLGINDWYPDPRSISLPVQPEIFVNGENMAEEDILLSCISHTYDIIEDDKNLRNSVSSFEKLRGDYPVRREFPAYQVHLMNTRLSTKEKLKKLGFKVII